MNHLINEVKESAEEVFNILGRGHTEAVYEAALERELQLRNNTRIIQSQVPCPIQYKGYFIGIGFIDILIDNLIVEIKSVAKLTSKDEAQIWKYMKSMNKENGLLINFSLNTETIEVFVINQPQPKECWCGYLYAGEHALGAVHPGAEAQY